MVRPCRRRALTPPTCATGPCRWSPPTAPIVFFRHFLMLLFLLPWLRREGAGALATRDRRGHLVRGLAGVSAVACYFYAIARLRLADAVLLNQSMPLFVP